MSVNCCDLMGFKIRYVRVGYGRREKSCNHFRSTGRKFPDSWEKTCYAVFMNEVFLGVLNGCGCNWYLIAPNREQDDACVTCGSSRNNAVMAFINRYLIAALS